MWPDRKDNEPIKKVIKNSWNLWVTKMALPGLPWSLSVCYDFAIGVVTNIIAAAILDSKAPSLLDDFDKDEAGNKDGKDSF